METFGPFKYREQVRDAIMEAGEEVGLKASANAGSDGRGLALWQDQKGPCWSLK